MNQFIFLGQKEWDDPLFRFYFDTLVRELGDQKYLVEFVNPCDPSEKIVDPKHHSIINFFYKDTDAIRAITELEAGSCTRVCFASDVENYEAYEDAYRVADAFICPSEMHKKVLGYLFDLPIYPLIEAIDPLIRAGGSPVLDSIKARRLVWFGYPESYRRSMPIFESTIQEALRLGYIDSFSVISLESLQKELPSTFRFLPFTTSQLTEQLKEHDLALLSHVPLDLSINSLIKSPNKAVSSIACGLIPICSDTPNYRELMDRLGLQQYLFESSRALGEILKTLAQTKNAQLNTYLNSAHHYIEQHFSATYQTHHYLKIVADLKIQKPSHLSGKVPLKLFKSPDSEIKLRFYVRQQWARLKRLLQSNA